MKIWKLVSGILSCVLFLLTSFQSCAATVANSLDDAGEVGGFGGILLSVLMLAGGIVSIVAYRNPNGKGLNIAIAVLYGIAALLGFATAGSYADLNIWAAWCLICAVLAIVVIFKSKKPKPEN